MAGTPSESSQRPSRPRDGDQYIEGLVQVLMDDRRESDPQPAQPEKPVIKLMDQLLERVRVFAACGLALFFLTSAAPQEPPPPHATVELGQMANGFSLEGKQYTVMYENPNVVAESERVTEGDIVQDSDGKIFLLIGETGYITKESLFRLEVLEAEAPVYLILPGMLGAEVRGVAPVRPDLDGTDIIPSGSILVGKLGTYYVVLVDTPSSDFATGVTDEIAKRTYALTPTGWLNSRNQLIGFQ